MKRVARVDWRGGGGCINRSISNNIQDICKTSIGVRKLSTLNSTKSHLTKFDRIQNQTLQIATGAAKSTLVVAMEKQKNTPPLIARGNKAAICLHEKLLTV
jgi:hypothetical protein